MANRAVHEFKIEVEHAGLGINKAELVGVETLGISIDGNKEEWKEIQGQGWTKNLVTGKSMTISVEGKWDQEDALHKSLIKDVIFGKSRNHNGFSFTLTFPKSDDSITTAASLTFEGSINPSDVFGGAATDVSPLKFEISLNGAPTYTEEAA